VTVAGLYYDNVTPYTTPCHLVSYYYSNKYYYYYYFADLTTSLTR